MPICCRQVHEFQCRTLEFTAWDGRAARADGRDGSFDDDIKSLELRILSRSIIAEQPPHEIDRQSDTKSNQASQGAPLKQTGSEHPIHPTIRPSDHPTIRQSVNGARHISRVVVACAVPYLHFVENTMSFRHFPCCQRVFPGHPRQPSKSVPVSRPLRAAPGIRHFSHIAHRHFERLEVDRFRRRQKFGRPGDVGF